MHQGFYSLVQLHPDRFRREGVNVGVLVGSEDLRTLRVRFAETSQRAKRMFPGARIDDRGLAAARRALERRLTEVEPTEEGLRSFIKKESSQLVILPPLRARIETIDATIARLFDELVADPGPMPNVVCPRCSFAFDPAASVPHCDDWRRPVSALRPNTASRPRAWLTSRTSPLTSRAPDIARGASPTNVVTSLSSLMGAHPQLHALDEVSLPVTEPQSNVFQIAVRSERIWS